MVAKCKLIAIAKSIHRSKSSFSFWNTFSDRMIGSAIAVPKMLLALIRRSPIYFA